MKKRKQNRLIIVDDFGVVLEHYNLQEIIEDVQDEGKTLKLFIKRGDLNFRMDGRVEWVCEHGVGHTIRVPFKYINDESWWSHGCDDCCSKNKEVKERMIRK